MTEALDVGAALAARLVDEGARCLVTGDMGIGEHDAVGRAHRGDHRQTSGRGHRPGTGIDDSTLARKVTVIERALVLHAAALPMGR